MKERLKVIPAVFTAVTDLESVLLVERQNTGFLDGSYDFPSGHLEDGEDIREAAAREVKEETSVVVEPGDLELFHIYQHYLETDKPYIYFIFRAFKWSGDAQNQKNEKVGNVRFYSLSRLPGKLLPHVQVAINEINTKEVTYTLLR